MFKIFRPVPVYGAGVIRLFVCVYVRLGVRVLENL